MHIRKSLRLASKSTQELQQQQQQQQQQLIQSQQQLQQPQIQLQLLQEKASSSQPSSQEKMNIELSTEQLELQLNPDNNFIPPCFLSQPTKASQETTPVLAEGPLALTSPTSSQVVPENDWRFNDPNVLKPCSNPDIYDPEMAVQWQDILANVAYTPQPTPPLSPHSADNENSIHSNDDLRLEQVDFDQLLNLAGSMESMDGFLDEDIESLLSSQPSNDPAENIDSSALSPAEPEPEIEHEPEPGPSSEACPSTSSITKTPPKAKSTRGRKRKLTHDRDERKREQNASAAKRYRAKKQEEQERIFAEKQQLENEVQEARKKVKAKMNQRNIILVMLYELVVKEKKLSNFTFPPWMEEFYEKYRNSSAP